VASEYLQPSKDFDVKIKSARATASEAQSKSSDVIRRVHSFGDAVDRVSGQDINPLTIVIDEQVGPVESIVDGRHILMFGTNSYLGLNFHPACIRASVEATQRYGTGSTASRVAAGSQRLHVDLEQAVADFHGMSDAVVFSTGYMANLGVISALCREGDAVVIDSHSHASIVDGARLSGASVQKFNHNDPQDLERLFRESNIPGERTVVVLEGVYSVWGDIGELAAAAAIARRYRATVVVDEAHSMGIYGEHGRGVVEHLGLQDDVDVIVGTFSKSVGVIGGYCVTNSGALRALRYMARPYLFTASLPPAIVATAREALRVIESEPGLRAKLWRNAEALHGGLKEIGFALRAPAGPVGSIRMPGFRPCHEFWKGLFERGIYVNLLIPPSTPDGEVALRFSVSAAHTPEQVARAIEVFGEVAKVTGVLSPEVRNGVA
jgi:8-amino-7-oxononanoate synthase